MELNIIKENQNPLFERKELEGIIKAQVIPSKIEVAKTLAEKYSVPMEAIKIIDIQGNFGTRNFKLRANIYTSKEERDNLENISKKEKETEAKALEDMKPKEEPKGSKEPKEEASTEEKPVEEIKEEAPKEVEETK